ncbi:MAG TPA: hypothetical protein VFG76_08955, partial [Candidatus Polarisedimenticolia bacterium]|nr:hypothetical protein [Candidatus Polarisedimenticolia bacterium]
MTISCTPEDLETLRLLARAGAEGASRALEEMTGLRVAFTEPRLGPVGVEDATRLIGDEQVEVVALLLDIVEDLPAALLITFAPDTARRLLAAMLPDAGLPPDEIPEIHRSGLIEVGNVLGAAYANALA